MTPRRVCIDCRMIGASGIGTYLRGLLSGLSDKKPPALEFALLGRASELIDQPWDRIEVDAPIYSFKEQVAIPRAFRRSKAALLHSPHYNVPLRVASRAIVTVHDLIHLKFPQYLSSNLAKAYAKFYFHFVIPRTRAILTVSENTKRDLMEMLRIPAERVTVAYPAISKEFTPQARDLCRRRLAEYQLPEEYLLYVGNLKESKNIAFLLEGYRTLKTRRPDLPPLVLVGRNFIPGIEKALAQNASVRWIGEMKPESLPSLYAAATLFIFPSLYEGFGLPPLEAMACGAPVLCSDRASLPEVAGDAAVFFNPESLEDFMASLERVLQDSSLRRQLRDKGLRRAALFSWDALAEKTLSLYSRHLS